jgi:hypothetical protein
MRLLVDDSDNISHAPITHTLNFMIQWLSFGINVQDPKSVSYSIGKIFDKFGLDFKF